MLAVSAVVALSCSNAKPRVNYIPKRPEVKERECIEELFGLYVQDHGEEPDSATYGKMLLFCQKKRA